MGVSAKKSFKEEGTYSEKTYYGVCNQGHWPLNGKKIETGIFSYGLTGDNKETIRERINMNHFKSVEHLDIDLYLDASVGLKKMRRVGYKLDSISNEVQITNINNAGNETGWIPHFIFTKYTNCEQTVQFASIDASLHEKPVDIKW